MTGEHLSGIDWQRASHEDRKRLYKALVAISSRLDVHTDDVLNAALGLPDDYFWADKSNLRQGKLDRDKSQMLYRYLADEYYALAQEVDEELFPYREIRDVDAYLAKVSLAGRLRILVADQVMGLVRRKGRSVPPDATLKLGQDFCFELDAVKAGFAVAFQGYQNEWHALPLGEDGETYACRIQEGVQILPRWQDGTPEPLTEDEGGGEHAFLILTSGNRNRLMNRGKLPDRLDRLDVYLTRVAFE
ncbi:MAG: hypothetical protein EP341_11585 [Sphingomonadales bacterium]|nr:MAG: hypothetical protein EP341_11585 [Sphingomonadales bacterium]